VQIVNETVDRGGNTRNNIRSMNMEEEKAKEKLTKRRKPTKRKEKRRDDRAIGN